MNLDRLKAPFAHNAIEWRVGATNKEKTKGIALAYIDARAVMDRLDKVCGVENWQCRYSHVGEKTCCEIGLYLNTGDTKAQGWIWKSDGAGDTDFEGAKGAFSDAFKRAAVRWGIGRYLYSLESPWVDIEPVGRSYRIKKTALQGLYKTLPGDASEAGGPLGKMELKTKLREFAADLEACEDEATLIGCLNAYADPLGQCVRDLPIWWYGQDGGDVKGLSERIETRKKELATKAFEGGAA